MSSTFVRGLTSVSASAICVPTNFRHILASGSVALNVTTVRFLSDKAPAKGKPQKFSSKSVNKKKKTTSSGEKDKSLDLVLRCLDAPKLHEPPISEEEKQRRYNIGRNHVIGRFERHNSINHDLACKLVLKHHAIKMLPQNSKVRDAAVVFEDNLEEEIYPPQERQIPLHTPPLPRRPSTR